MGSYRRGSSIGLRIDELSAHRDVLTGALDRAAESPGVLLSRLTAPNWNSYWLLSVKDHIGDGVKPGIVNHHNVLDAVHTVGIHDFLLGVGLFLLCRKDRDRPLAHCQHVR